MHNPPSFLFFFFFLFLTVIRAKISGEKIVSPSNSSSPYMKMIQYEIKMIKVRSMDSSNSCCGGRHIPCLQFFAAVCSFIIDTVLAECSLSGKVNTF